MSVFDEDLFVDSPINSIRPGIHINESRARRMPGDTRPDTTPTFWFDYFWWPRAAKPAAPAPKKTYREALLSNMPAKQVTAAEHDALLHDTYLFV